MNPSPLWAKGKGPLFGAVSGDAEFGKDSPYGQKYEIRGTLRGASGRSARVLTVWIVRFGADVPQFVTAIPED